MQITMKLNGKPVTADIAPDMTLLQFVRSQGCYSVKCGCETTNCGLCTLWMDGKPVLSCSVPAARADGHEIVTLEGCQEEAAEFGAFLADQGAEQCGYCSPGFIMNVLALFREYEDPTEEEIKEYLAGNLCRCSGYEGQLRAIRAYMAHKKGGESK
ncbi:(2Fe-2S)-binding protein [Anaerotignum lactatifermentans]|uniref:(2Fe-2S)-binding protein n=1 Tax=Anaerotignum lactatifermentans TaxID=160404 RepID=A0ABS2G8I8_9FIRM|nr:(2Fe-2S)-binding protein [Anaerotignum lactatifermentans]MBM6829433.1 (2Fe-2S)-binding protein [Anaerotignum lactatifermentans]MBM6877791.1 (2Fe-2S)-binding protein [Anaerotignum lactatifermentans]MBM6951010.1 (2Fe-2S)-binding protein [Anaerotignum lactatifermentans]